MKDVILDANFPRTSNGRVYHLGIKHGELANRVVTVGDPARALRLAAHFDGIPEQHFKLHSERGFLTITGKFEGTLVSVVAIGMGAANMDFLVREGRECVDGDMAMIRFGSCGGLIDDLPVGSLVVPQASVAITRNLDFNFLEPATPTSHIEAYHVSKPVAADENLHKLLLETLVAHKSEGVPASIKGDCVNATADSFYSSQGRITSFPDHNHHLVESLLQRVDKIASLEMETFNLFHLAAMYRPVRIPDSLRQAPNSPFLMTIPPTRLPASPSIVKTTLPNPFDKPPELTSTGGSSSPQRSEPTQHGRIYAAAVQMIFASRTSGAFITPEQVKSLEEWAGLMCLKTLARWQPPSEN
jgi:uridine phosphorylase